MSPKGSLNGIDASFENIEQLYKHALTSIRIRQEDSTKNDKDQNKLELTEKEIQKKIRMEMPKRLPVFLLKPPTHEELIKIAAEMGVALSFKLANQASYYARSYSTNDEKFDTDALIQWFC